MGKAYKQLTLAAQYQIHSFSTLVFSARRMGGYLHRSNKKISLALKRYHLGAYDAEEAHRHSLQRRKTATKFHKSTDVGKSAGEVPARLRLRLYTGANCRAQSA